MESGNDYVIQVKGNAPKLHKWILNTINILSPADIDYTQEKSRGRIERRECWVYKPTSILEDYSSCKTIIHIRNHGVRNGKAYEEQHYYISNKTIIDSIYYQQGIRGHWSIENSCHWVKDAIMYEDKSRVKGMHLSENLSTLRHIVLNIYRLNNYRSIKKGIEKYCNKLNESLLLIKALCI